ncbi:NUDIX hydrolase [Paraburkholderia phenazinium]|uniref:ADP-ribose pyrophosphatase YjhB, NUDIX family n=1 Tax=Paraburkholderia phenazinium TaxID=60549 RepID=A0A1N6KB22_9BURK|nr:NUDIX hydrolase [Paraburkholderia phenazinium]SIO53799.1 ADP-ribose pyrophosphatase YjhB, NUDIX family [Paraburkholderia phenazinium]
MNALAESMQRRLTQARRLLAIAQTGLHYTDGAFDRERYQELLGIAQAQLAEVADISTEEVAQLFSREEGYANPKLDVRCAVFDDAGRVLLVREASDGLWSLPGGWADIGASPAENAMREVWEESGYTVTIERLLAVWDILKHKHPPSVFHIWKLVFLGKIVSSGDISGVETDAVEFFPIDALPPLSEGRVLPEQIRRLAELRANGGMEFD